VLTLRALDSPPGTWPCLLRLGAHVRGLVPRRRSAYGPMVWCPDASTHFVLTLLCCRLIMRSARRGLRTEHWLTEMPS